MNVKRLLDVVHEVLKSPLLLICFKIIIQVVTKSDGLQRKYMKKRSQWKVSSFRLHVVRGTTVSIDSNQGTWPCLRYQPDNTRTIF